MIDADSALIVFDYIHIFYMVVVAIYHPSINKGKAHIRIRYNHWVFFPRNAH